jgi:hypothetical protein
LEDVKTQAKKMKLMNVPVVKKSTTPQNTTVKKLRSLIPNGKLPSKGTIRREEVEDEILHQLFVVRNEAESSLNSSVEDLDDQVSVLLEIS